MPRDELTAKESESIELSDQKAPKSGLAAGVAILIALGSLALSGLVWWEGRDLHPQENTEANNQIRATLEQLRQAQSGQAQEMTDLAARIDQLPTDSSNEEIANLESNLTDHIDQNQGWQDALDTHQSYTRSLQQAIESMQARLIVAETSLAARAPALSNTPDQFNLAGVEYLLRLAPERLTLFHDLRAADAALVSADTQLAAMDNPVYLGLRQHIAEARQALAEAQLPDQTEISASLDNIQQQLAALTFGGEAVAQTTGENADSGEAEAGWWQRLKTSLAGLVTVRRNTNDADSRLTLEDKDLLRQGLWMQVEGARLALMRHDQASWQDTLTRAERVLVQWFDPSSQEYQSVHQQLNALMAISVSPELPDITGPWAQLQLIRQVSPAPIAAAPVQAEEQALAIPAESEMPATESQEVPVPENDEDAETRVEDETPEADETE